MDNQEYYANISLARSDIFPRLIDVTLEDLNAGLESGLFSSTDLVHVYLARIKNANPVTNAVTEVNPDAHDIALELDRERANGIIRG